MLLSIQASRALLAKHPAGIIQHETDTSEKDRPDGQMGAIHV
jgi:hypothetical protein